MQSRRNRSLKDSPNKEHATRSRAVRISSGIGARAAPFTIRSPPRCRARDFLGSSLPPLLARTHVRRIRPVPADLADHPSDSYWQRLSFDFRLGAISSGHRGYENTFNVVSITLILDYERRKKSPEIVVPCIGSTSVLPQART